ncbi:MAG: GDP-L-fucose synthase [Desulfitobacteriaceae bacterium]|jgi:GDP-L-fucose synthase|nr:GDP-L-fucose synthase [Desulfitobacteriaceae bacterium]
MKKDAAIYVAGHKGLVGSAILRKLKSEGYSNLITRSFQELDLRDRTAVDEFFKKEQPEFIFLAAAKVGGILANNTYPVDFLRDNLRIQTNIIDAAHKYGVKKLLFLGSSCIYPKLAPQPIKEEYLLTGELEPTNEPYAIAKIAGIKLCQAYNRQYQANFISVMPTNLYGPGDNFDLETSHVMPALIRKFHEAKINSADQVVVWGSGKPFREFLHVDDLADACLFLMNNYNSSEIINIGTGKDLSIAELAHMIKDIVGYSGDIVFDTSKPDGTPRKLLDVSKLFDMGWKPRITLEEGIRTAYNWYQEHQKPLS